MTPLDRILEVVLAIVSLAGNLLALPIWWWLFGDPVARLWMRCHKTGKEC